MKKVIEQETFKSVEVDKREFVTFISQYSKITVDIDNSKAREVAISICPELGEPTIKTDNTKVILHLESELEKQNELYKGLKELGHERITKLESELKEAVELIENARVLIYTATFDAPNICELMKKDIESFSNKSEAFLTKHK